MSMVRVDCEGPLPPRLEELQSDEQFLQANQWRIRPLASLLHKKGTSRLLKHFFEVYGTGFALEHVRPDKEHPFVYSHRGLVSTTTRLLDPEHIQCALEERLDILLDANPLALRVHHHKTRRFPLAAALDKGLPLRIMGKMVMLWPTAARLREPVTGLYVSMLAATTGYYTVHV